MPKIFRSLSWRIHCSGGQINTKEKQMIKVFEKKCQLWIFWKSFQNTGLKSITLIIYIVQVYFFSPRFISKRRLLLISAPAEDDYSFQQQISALSGQECSLGKCHATTSALIFDALRNVAAESHFPSNHQDGANAPETVFFLMHQLKR